MGTLISSVLSAIPSSPSWTLEGPLPRLLPELQRIKDSVKCDTLDGQVPGHYQEQLTQTLIVHFLKHLFSLFQKIGSRPSPFCLSGNSKNFPHDWCIFFTVGTHLRTPCSDTFPASEKWSIVWLWRMPRLGGRGVSDLSHSAIQPM